MVSKYSEEVLNTKTKEELVSMLREVMERGSNTLNGSFYGLKSLLLLLLLPEAFRRKYMK